MKSKVLLLGGSGNLGSEIIRSNLFKNIYAPKRKFLNILSIFQINRILKKYKPNIIINCASLARMKICEQKVDEAIKVNIFGTLNLVKAILEYEKIYKKKIKLIHLSSDAVYPSVKGNYEESAKLGPYNVYGWTKLSGEFVIRTLKHFIIIRTRFYNEKKVKYKFSASDIFTSQINIKFLPKYIKYLIKENYNGIINVGGKKISDFKLYKKFLPNLKSFKRKHLIKHLRFQIAKDASLNLRKFNLIKKKYE